MTVITILGIVMIKRLFKLLFIMSALSSLFSCATQDEMQMLDSSLRSYERAIRWGDFTRAKSFHKNAPSLNDIERRRLKFYRVSAYNVLSEEVPNDMNAFLQVEIKYYKNERPVIKTIVVNQRWKRLDDSKIWYVDSAFPKFK